ncbi:hypothetical protein GCM10020218_063580 [Dactylosporangium vinaceum]
MPTFDTPAPVAVTVVLDTGRVRCVATQRRDTAVAVLPAGTSAAAIAAAEQTTIEHGAGLLTVKAPHRAILRPGGGIDVFLEVPAGSSLEVHTVRADIRTEGELGDCRFSTVTGPIHLEHVGALRVSTSGSDVVAGLRRRGRRRGRARPRACGCRSAPPTSPCRPPTAASPWSARPAASGRRPRTAPFGSASWSAARPS